MKYLIIFLIFNINCVSQNNFSSSAASRIAFANSQLESEYLAKEDIETKNIYIFLEGDWDSIVYSTDKGFEKKYNVIFIDQGCIESKFSLNYNFVVYNFIYKTYGRKWMKEIRKDALGLKEWKRNKAKKTILKI